MTWLRDRLSAILDALLTGVFVGAGIVVAIKMIDYLGGDSIADVCRYFTGG